MFSHLPNAHVSPMKRLFSLLAIAALMCALSQAGLSGTRITVGYVTSGRTLSHEDSAAIAWVESEPQLRLRLVTAASPHPVLPQVDPENIHLRRNLTDGRRGEKAETELRLGFDPRDRSAVLVRKRAACGNVAHGDSCSG